ncbi:hypothetical protein SLEP1_g36678 [Rubroshorea leprosula]|uniref:BHLH domain-containing protein n=1 Tax=Rubroshorea leprosula TaxID=152421 RepID=A0AAV5KS90_9ROSI|nr:hypothetical protein SLEP1_g36678 [Rubroshorea leprosula]
MSLLYTSSNFSYADVEFRKSLEFLDHSNHYHQQHYRSTTPETETETFLSKYMMLPSNGLPNCDSASHDIQQFGHKAVKQETTDSLSHQNGYSNGSRMMLLQGSDSDSAGDGNTMDTPFIGFENSMPGEMTTGNASALLRHSSSPAEFFSNFGVENGLSFRASSGTNNEAGPSPSRLYNHLDYFFSSGPSSHSMPMSQTTESENQGIRVNNGGLSNSCGSKIPFIMSTMASDSWQNASLSGQKRARGTEEGSLFCRDGSRTSPAQNGDSRDRASVLTHHLSLPKTFGEMGAIEKIFQFQSHVPCKIRAKRGCATHPRSIAERVRRSRISERMRKLQDLFPDLDKQTNTADMLDMAVEYIKDLQKQVKALTDTKAKCRCSSKQKHYSIASA